MTDEKRLADSLIRGAKALEAGDHEGALAPLRTVVEHSGLAAAESLRDIRARALSLLAQAELAAGLLDDARAHGDRSLRLAQELEDRQGMEVVRELVEQIRAALVERTSALARTKRLREATATPLDSLRTLARTPYELIDLLVERANAEIEAGDVSMGSSIAKEALVLAVEHGALREEILARLSLSRADPSVAAEQLLLAWRRAEKADAFTLVGAIARAAEAHGVVLPHLSGPQMGPDLY